ncbi:hypothetical protein [Pseudoalteromonas rhizosphaerae]|uniref:hypothetical protein n=1 Tax=Pseudoalteromonas rhizosphaerae TaxID=2518973 RepID=UPI00214836E3|nr:hypothetical protein [Pseudoalteromonas rhizosphaerae]
MADINISENNGLVSITLDRWEWTGLTVNGDPINKTKGPIQFQYNQANPGPIHFVATANQYIVLFNEGNLLYMKSADGLKTYLCLISYQETEDPKVVTLHGVIHTLDFVIPQAKNSPLGFSQGRMTGTFQNI